MSKISDLITEIRCEIGDENNTRFETDAPILSVIKRAIRRSNRIVQRHALQFAKKSIELTTVAGQDYIPLSGSVSDLDVVIGLWYPDKHRSVHLCTEREWNQIVSAFPLVHALLDYDNDRIRLNGTPDAAVTLELFYFPVIDVSTLTTESDMPWEGSLDDIVLEYAANRLKNLDEMDFSFDLKLMSDMETQIIQAYEPNSPLMSEGEGWI